jgi:flagellar hook-associated protein 2
MGKLILDDAALDAALANPDKVKTLLGAGGVPGFAQKLEGLLDKHAASGGVLDERLKINSAQIDRIKDSMAAAEQRITAKEKRLKAQFAAMEKAMGLAQSQQAWLSGQISALSK